VQRSSAGSTVQGTQYVVRDELESTRLAMTVNSPQPPWNEQWPVSGSGGVLKTGTVFGCGSTGPFTFSATINDPSPGLFSNWSISPVYEIPGLVFRAEEAAQANTIPFPLIVGGARTATWSPPGRGLGRLTKHGGSPVYRARAPGRPTAADGYVPPKGGAGSRGEMVKNPNGPGRGYLDDKGNVWVPTGTAGAPGTGTTGPAHGGPHWDVESPGGGHTNVYPGGRVR